MLFLRLLCSIFTLGWMGLVALVFLNRFMKARFNILEVLAFSWMAGMGVISLQLFLYSLLGIPFTVWTLFSLPAVLAVCSFSKARLRNEIFSLFRSDPLNDIPREWLFYLCVAIVAIQISFAFVHGLSLPISGWDAWAIWLLKGKIFFIEKGLSGPFLQSALPMHPDYPLLVPLSATWVYVSLGQANDQLVRILYSLQYFSLIVIFNHFVKELTSKRKAAFFSALLSLIPILMIHGGGLFPKMNLGGLYSGDFVGYADLPLAIYFLASSGFLALGILKKNGGFFLGALFFAALAAWTKNEGLTFWAASSGLVLFFGLRQRLFSWKHWVAAGAFLCLFIIPWALYKHFSHIGNEYLGNLSLEILKAHSANFQIIVSKIARLMFGNLELYNLVWYAYFFAQARNIRRIFSPVPLCLNLLLFFQLGTYVFVYLITPRELDWQLGTSLDRILLHLTPLAFLIAAVNFFQVDAFLAIPSAEAAPPGRRERGSFFTEHKGRLLVLRLGVLLGLVVYAKSWGVPFQFDDDSNIMANVSIHSVANIPAIWAENIKTRFLPYCSFALNYGFNRELVFGYHLFNFGIHVFNAFWVYLLVLLLFKTPKMRASGEDKSVHWLAVFSALIFLSHPLQTQAVTYIVQRITSMAAFFYLGAVVFYLRSRLGGKRSDYALALAMTVGAMFCKENAFTLPLALVLTDGMFFGFPRGERLAALKRLLPFLLTMAIIPYYIREASEQLASSGFLPMQKDALPRWEYFLTELNVLRTYLRLLVFPVNQNLDYDYPAARSLLEMRTFFSCLILAGLVAAAFKFMKKYRLLAFGIFWFFLTLSVESSVLPINDVIFEHRMYLPLAGCAVFLSVALYFFLGNRKHFIAAGAVVVLVFSSMAYMRNEVWQSDISLWSDVVKKAPKKARGYNNLGQSYSTRKGGDVKAKEYFEKAIELDPEYPQPYYNLGVICDGKGESDKAKAFYEKAIALDPEYLSPVNNLAILYGQKGELDRAVETLQKALEISPRYVVGYDNLGVAYDQKGDVPKAIESFEKAIQINPYYPPAYLHLGILLRKQGSFEKAGELFRKASELEPNYPDPVLELGKLQAQKGETEKAKEAVMKLKRMQQPEMVSQLEAALSGEPAQEEQGGLQMRTFGPEFDDSGEMSEKDKKLRKIMRQVKLVQQVRRTQAVQRMHQPVIVYSATVSQPATPVVVRPAPKTIEP